MAKTVTDEIGEEYEDWKFGDVVFISSPTGSGKTYFILNKLFLYLVKCGRRILYLVNRAILRDQLEKMIKDSEELFPYTDQICIKLYQEIEMRVNELRYKQLEEQISFITYDDRIWAYDCVVCDECHYFLADANFNTKTDLSFWWVQDMFQYKLRIFMSATIDEVEKYIRNDIEKECCFRTDIYRTPSNRRRKLAVSGAKIYRYPKTPQEKNYSYIVPKVIERENIAGIVSDEKGKWLVFVDDIKFGRKLEKEIKERLKEKQIDESEEAKDTT